jgi:hypothetical protein
VSCGRDGVKRGVVSRAIDFENNKLREPPAAERLG